MARESSVKRRTVDNYFGILEDTLLGFRLPALQLNWRVKETATPSFIFLMMVWRERPLDGFEKRCPTAGEDILLNRWS